MSKVILVGGGASIQEGIAKDLWIKIHKFEKWSLNSAFKAMPYLPDKELWVDIDFLDNNLLDLQKLHSKGVKLICKSIANHNKYAYLFHMNIFTQYQTTRERDKYYGKQAIEKNLIYYGQMGLCGMFALHVAIAMGYKDIFLLGYDFGSPSLGHRLTHFYQENMAKYGIYSTGAGRPEVYRLPGDQLRSEIEDFKLYTQGHDSNIWNVSLISNIKCFPQISYDEFFQKLNEPVSS